VTIGRDEAAAQLVLKDKSVGRLHARIRWRDGRYWLYDEGSASGTFLNHDRLGLSPRQLQDGDEIRIGRILLRFQLRPPAADSTKNDQTELNSAPDTNGDSEENELL
jgi:predicted component of type VI protein secretion system